MKNHTIKKILIFIPVIFIVYCPVLDRTGLNPSHIKGSEAKIILRERLSSFFIKDMTDDNSSALTIDFLSSNLATINDSSYYKRRDVEHCATMIYMTSLAIHKSKTSYSKSAPVESRILPPLLCKLKPAKEIITF